MIFTKIVTGTYAGTGVGCTATLYFVFPPGFDAYLPSITPQTLTKLDPSLVHNVGEVVGLDGSLRVLATAGQVHFGVVAAASGSGSPTVDVRVLFDVDTTYIQGLGGTSGSLFNDGTIPGPGIVGQWFLPIPVGPFPVAPPSVLNLYGYRDAGGVVGYTTSAATAAANPQSWIAGSQKSTEPDPTTTYLSSPALVDRFDLDASNCPTWPECSGLAKAIQATGSMIPGAPVYLDETGTACAVSPSNTYNRQAGVCVHLDTSTSPQTMQVVPHTLSLLSDAPGKLAGILDRPRRSRARVDVTNIFGGSYSMGTDADFGRLRYIALCRIVDTWDNSGAIDVDAVPTSFSQLVVPRLSGAPTCAIDCTLPAPFGAVRIIWYGGDPHLCEQVSPSTPPRTGMTRTGMVRGESNEKNPGAGGAPRNQTTAFRGLPGWGDLPYPISVGPGQWQSGNFGRNYGPVGWGMDCTVAPSRIGDLTDINCQLRFADALLPGATAARVYATWARVDLATSPTVVPYNGMMVACSAPQLIAGTFSGNAFICNDTITSRPTGTDEDIGVYIIRYELYGDFPGTPNYLLNTVYQGPFSRGSPSGGWELENGSYYFRTSELVTGGASVKKTVWPLDIMRWQPTANDADCTWVGNTGWAYPSPPQATTLGWTGTFSATWSAGSFTVSAKPTPSTTVVTGTAYVRTLDTVSDVWAFHARIPSLSLVYTPRTAGTFPAAGNYYWTGMWAGQRISETGAAVPATFPAARPSAGTTPAEVSLWSRVERYSNWGNTVRAASGETRLTINVG